MAIPSPPHPMTSTRVPIAGNEERQVVAARACVSVT